VLYQALETVDTDVVRYKVQKDIQTETEDTETDKWTDTYNSIIAFRRRNSSFFLQNPKNKNTEVIRVDR
jgi:hypothetical protein